MTAAATSVVCVYVTAGSPAQAQDLATTLVEERLAACVNIVPGVRSVYRWEGRIRHEDEVVLLAKTSRERASELCRRVQELHSYEIPCAVVYAAESGLPAYLAWVIEESDPVR